ncbi:MAG TPA: endolytic transglycosylase MltG [Clostridiaceae bacterium]
MKKKYFIRATVVILVLIASVTFLVNRNTKKAINTPLVSTTDKVDFEIKPGQTLTDVIAGLNSMGLIKDKKIVMGYIEKHGLASQVVPGKYSISNFVSLENLVYYMNNGILDNKPVKVTIPEGYDVEGIAGLLESKGLISKSEFLKSCKEYKLPGYIKNDINRKYALEGYLFPDTYEFYKGSKGQAIIDEMTSRFKDIIDDISKKTGKTITNEELDKYITMASVVEKEAKVQTERGKVASVFYNRLKINMKLESCATVLYALGYHKDVLSYDDLKVDSAYNTYKVQGLPAGPIANPGRACIEAAISPESTNYLYFVSKNNGIHFFTNNYNEFLNVKAVTQGF